MVSLFKQWLARLSGRPIQQSLKVSGKSVAKRKEFVPQVEIEHLEDRMVLSAGDPISSTINVATGGAGGNQNDYFKDYDRDKGTATLSNGNIVVTWDARNNAAATPVSPDGDSWGVFFKVFGPTGTPVSGVVSPPLDVHPTGTGFQSFPSVVALTGGGFAITWQDEGDSLVDGDGDTYVRVYDNSGIAVSGSVKINELEPGGGNDDQVTEDIVALTGGGFAIVWRDDNNVFGNNTDDYFARAFTAAGAAAGASVRLGGVAHDPFFQDYGDLVALSNGGFATAWKTRNNGGTPSPDGAGYGAFIQVFNSSGASVGSAFTPYSDTNAAGTGNQNAPKLAALEAGGFAATWNSVSGPGDVFVDPYGYGGDTYVRVFNNSGTAVSSTLKVNDLQTADEETPSAIIGLVGGDFVIVWHDEENATGNLDDYFVRTYNANGTAKGASIQLGGVAHDNFFKDYDLDRGIVALTNGGFVAAWRTRDNGVTPSPDGAGYGAFYQVFNNAGASVTSATAPYLDINAAGTGDQNYPILAPIANGGFAMTWNSAGGPGDVYIDAYGYGGDTYTRLFDNTGTALHGTIKAHESEPTGTNDEQDPSAIVSMPDGNYAIIIRDENEQTNNKDDLFLRIFEGVAGAQAPGTVSIAKISDATEGGGNGKFRVTQTVTSGSDTVVTYSIGGTAANGTDYTTLTGSVTIPTGQTTADIDISLLADTIVEGTENVIITLTGFSAGNPAITLDPTPANLTSTATITDNDTNTLTISSPTVTEGNAGTTTMTFTVTSPNAVVGGFTVAFGVTNVSASAGDYSVATSSPLTFTGTAGETRTIIVNVNGDTVVEGNETFTVTLGVVTPVAPVQAASIVSGASGTGTINNDDTSTLTISSPTVTEGNGGTVAMTFTVTSPSAVQGGFTVAFGVANGSADAADYSLVTASPLTFAGTVGETQTITVNVSGDLIVEGNETLTVTLGVVTPVTPVQAASIGSGAVGTGTITNDDTTTLSISSPTIAELTGGTNDLVFTVNSTTAVQGGFTVAFSITDLTTEPGDYTLLTTSPLTFNGGVGEQQSIVLRFNSDTDVESDETLNVTLGVVTPVAPVQPASIVSGAVGVGTVLNDDTTTLLISSPTVSEGDAGFTQLNFIVTAPEAVEGGFLVDFSVLAGTADLSDYSIVTGSPLTFAGTAGEQQTITINVIGDTTVEADENFTITLGTVTPLGSVDPADIITGATGTGTIDNDDVTNLTISSPTILEGDNGVTILTFNVTSSNAVDGGFTVDFTGTDGTADGADYAILTSSPLTFAGTAGEIHTITVNVVNDTIVEGDETFTITLGTVLPQGPVDANDIVTGAIGTGTIANDDSTTLSIDSPTVVEGDSGTVTLTFNVVSTNAVQGGFTVDFSVTDITTGLGDYTVVTASPLNFAGTAGEIQTITVTVNGDTTVEGDETFDITLGAVTPVIPVQAASIVTGDVGTGTITNDDSTNLTIDNPTVTEGDAGVTVLTFTVTSSNAVQGGFTVDFALADLFTSPNDYTLITASPLTFLGTADEQQTITVNVIGDTIVEGDETLTITLGAVTPVPPVQAASINTGAVGTGTITNDDTTTFTITSPTVVEGDNGTTAMTFDVTSSNAVENDFQLAFSVANGTTSAGDYSVVTLSPLLFSALQAGQTVSITVNINGDVVVEGDETLTVTLGAVTVLAPIDPADFISGAVGTGTITNDDSTTLTIDSPTVIEGNNGTTALTFTVTSSNAVEGGFTVAFSVADLLTSAGDYVVVTNSPLAFSGTAGETQTIVVNVTGDTTVEGDETLTATLGAVTPVPPVQAASINTGAVGTGTITNDDTTTLTISSPTVTEGNSGTTVLTYTVTSSNAVEGGFDVAFAVADISTDATDYTVVTGSPLVFAGTAGEQQTITVNVVGDTIVEGDETFSVTLGAATSVAPVQAANILTGAVGIGTITNDDTTTLTISSPTVTETDAGVALMTFTVTSSNAVQGGFTVAFSAADGTATAADYAVQTASPLTFAGTAGETQTITVNLVGDLIVEADEAFTITLGAATPTGIVDAADIVTGAVGTGTIDDNDTATVSIARIADGAEAPPTNGQFRVTQSLVSSTDTVINYTVTGTATAGAGSDYTTLSGTVTIPAGQTTADIDVTVLDDLLVESTETVIVTLTGFGSHDADITLDPVPANVTATMDITSDDVPTITSVATADVAENTATATVVLNVDVNDALIAAGATITYSLSGPDAARFNINPTTGEITFAASPDFEVPLDAGADNVYNVTVTATASTVPSQAATQDLTITVTAVNDNSPIFANASPTFTLAENTAALTVVGGVSATDADVPPQTLTYSIVNGNTNSAFAIDPATGQITVANANALNFETTPTFTLTVRAADNGTPELTADATVVINLTDVFEGPTFTNLGTPVGTYHLEKEPGFVAPDAIYDFDNNTNPDYSSAVLTVTISAGSQKKDELSIFPKGEGPGRINIKGKKVLFSDVEIGKFEGGKGKKGALTVTFNSNATTEAVDNLIRRVSFFAKDGVNITRTITFALTGVSGLNSNVFSRDLRVLD